MKAREARRLATEQGLAIAAVLRRQRDELRSAQRKVEEARERERARYAEAAKERQLHYDFVSTVLHAVGRPTYIRGRTATEACREAIRCIETLRLDAAAFAEFKRILRHFNAPAAERRGYAPR